MNTSLTLSPEKIKERIISANLKATHQRIVIYSALFELNHPTAEQVYELIRMANPTISLGTVYKNLESFVESGLVKRVASEEGSLRFDAHLEGHHHIFCENTKEIIDFDNSELLDLIQDFFSKKKIENFRIKDFQLQIHGEKIDPQLNIKIHD